MVGKRYGLAAGPVEGLSLFGIWFYFAPMEVVFVSLYALPLSLLVSCLLVSCFLGLDQWPCWFGLCLYNLSVRSPLCLGLHSIISGFDHVPLWFPCLVWSI